MLGPYLVLGSIVVSSRSIDFVFDGPNVLALVAAGALFLVIGYVHGRIEAHMWNQCDRWRGMIAEIANAKVPINVPPERLQFAQALPKSYLWIFLAMLLPLAADHRVLLASMDVDPSTLERFVGQEACFRVNANPGPLALGSELNIEVVAPMRGKSRCRISQTLTGTVSAVRIPASIWCPSRLAIGMKGLR
jgi:hypothetical protein